MARNKSTETRVETTYRAGGEALSITTRDGYVSKVTTWNTRIDRSTERREYPQNTVRR